MSVPTSSIPSLYMLKAICAFFVGMIHMPFIFREALQPIIITAVPVFFIVTGYFFCVKSRQKGEKNTVARLLKHALIVTVVVNIIAFVYQFLTVENFTDLLKLTLVQFVFTKRAGMYFSYWYLRTLCISLFMIYLLYRFLPCRVVNRLMTFLPLLFAGSVLIGSYCYESISTFRLRFDLYHNALVVGIPCIATGYFIAKHESTLVRSHWASMGCLFLLAVGSCAERKVAEMLFSPMSIEYWFLTLPLAATMVLICLKHRTWGPGPLVSLGKYHSANIYYLHLGVFETLYLSSPALLYLPIVRDLQALLVFLICIPLSMGINLVSRRLSELLSKIKPRNSTPPVP